MKVHEFTLSSEEWGEIKVLRPIPHGKDGDRWGDMAALRGTPWESLIPVVTGMAMSHALHGHIMPLMNEIGAPPSALMRMLPPKSRICEAHKKCAMFDRVMCYPNPKMPECYLPPDLSPEAQMAAQMVAIAWKEDRYVVVVGEGEFS